MNDAGIVRNRAKIEGRRQQSPRPSEDHGRRPGLLEIPVGLRHGKPVVNTFNTRASVPASDAGLDQDFKGLAHAASNLVGPTIVYAFMQATGMVNDIWSPASSSATRTAAANFASPASKLIRKSGPDFRKDHAQTMAERMTSSRSGIK